MGRAIIAGPLTSSARSYILVSLSVRQLVEVLKIRSLLIKLSPRTRGLKNYSGPQVFTSYFYVYFCAVTVVVDEGDIFGIWRVGEKIWVRFFELRV
jgi:hypothetical protein